MKHNETKILGLAIFVAVITLVTAFLTIPSEKEILEKLITDQNYERVSPKYENIILREKDKGSDFYAWAYIWLQRKKDRLETQEDIQDALRKLLNLYEKKYSQNMVSTEIGQVLSLLPTQEELTVWFSQNLQKLHEWHQSIVLQNIQDASLLKNQPQLAATSLEYELQRRQPTLRDIKKLIQYWQWAGHPQQALDSLELFSEKAGYQPHLVTALAESKITLLRQLSRNSQALDFAILWFKSVQNEKEKETALNWIILTAQQCERINDALTYYLPWVEARPDDIHAWEQLATLATSAANTKLALKAYRHLVEVQPDHPMHRYWMAQILEWSNQPNEAFDQYLILAKQNNAKALERIYALNPGLSRDKDVIQLLESIVPNKGGHPQLINLADLFAHQGQHEKAFARYKQYLAANPNDYEVWIRLGLMQSEIMLFEEARQSFQKAAELKPEEIQPQKMLAQIHMLQGKYQQALSLYQNFAIKSNDPEILANYARLSEELGFYEDAEGAYKQLAKNPKTMEPNDFLQLSSILYQKGLLKERVEVLKQAVSVFPKDPSFKYVLSLALMDAQQYREALALFESLFRQNPDSSSLQLYLDLLLLNHDQKTAGLVAKKYWDGSIQDVQLTRAVTRAFFASGQNHLADNTLKRMIASADPYAWKLAAQIGEEFKQYQLALLSQKKLIDSGTATAVDWSYLGDLYRATGNEIMAKEIYNQAVKKSLAEETF